MPENCYTVQQLQQCLLKPDDEDQRIKQLIQGIIIGLMIIQMQVCLMRNVIRKNVQHNL